MGSGKNGMTSTKLPPQKDLGVTFQDDLHSTKQANWDGLSTEFDAAIEVNSIPENYGRFIELLRVVLRDTMKEQKRNKWEEVD